MLQLMGRIVVSTTVGEGTALNSIMIISSTKSSITSSEAPTITAIVIKEDVCRLGLRCQGRGQAIEARCIMNLVCFPCRSKAFTLVEVLVVLSIISLLAALLLPAFWTVQGKARQASCISNLRQIGNSVVMYTQDYDGYYPYAVDPSDRKFPSNFAQYPNFAADIANIGLIQDVLAPYAGERRVFRCPSDIGFEYRDNGGGKLDAFPTSYEKFGTSYYYRTELAAQKRHESSLSRLAQINMMMDGVGNWHGTLVPLAPRYNILFADGHAKNCSREQLNEAWQTAL